MVTYATCVRLSDIDLVGGGLRELIKTDMSAVGIVITPPARAGDGSSEAVDLSFTFRNIVRCLIWELGNHSS